MGPWQLVFIYIYFYGCVSLLSLGILCVFACICVWYQIRVPAKRTIMFQTSVNLTRSWEGEEVDCGVHPYKHSWIFQKWLTARIWDFSTFNIYFLGPFSQYFRSVSFFFFVETRAILSRLVGKILPRCENTTFFTICKNADKKLIWPR